MDETCFEDGKSEVGRIGWGPGSFKTGSSDKEIASLPHCLHLYISNLKAILSKQHQQNEIHQVYFSKNTVVSVILRHLQINTR